MEKNECYGWGIITKSISYISEKAKELFSNESMKGEFKYELHNSDERIKVFNLKASIPEEIQNPKSKELYQLWPIPDDYPNFTHDEMKSFNKTTDTSKE